MVSRYCGISSPALGFNLLAGSMSSLHYDVEWPDRISTSHPEDFSFCCISGFRPTTVLLDMYEDTTKSRRQHTRKERRRKNSPSRSGLRNGLRVLVTKEGLVAKLTSDVLGLVDLAIRALMEDLWRALTRPQNPVRHHPWLYEVVRVLDGHLVNNFVALPSQLLNDVQVGGMQQAAASVPGGIGEVGGIDHQRVALPLADRKPIVKVFDRFL